MLAKKILFYFTPMANSQYKHTNYVTNNKTNISNNNIKIVIRQYS